MRRLTPMTLASALLLAACAVNMGGERDISLATVALRANGATDPETAAAALREGGTRAALVMAPRDSAWFGALAEAAGMTLSGPARTAGGLGLAFLGREPLGDTAIDLRYDGGTFTVQDALYDLADKRFLDLLSFEVDDPAEAQPLVEALLKYVATDVSPTAAVVMAVAVPTAAAGDSVARMLSPGFEEARRCSGDGADAGGGGGGIRLFYGPEARIYCRTATVDDTPQGEWVRASLVMGRR